MIEKISMVALVNIPFAFAVLNTERGKNKIRDSVFAVLIGLVIAITFFIASVRVQADFLETVKSLFHNWKLSLGSGVYFGLFAFWWNTWGWGRYFTAGHGDYNIWNTQHDDPLVDFIADRVYGRNLTTYKQAVRAGTFAMNLRAWSFYPGFALVAWAAGDIRVAIIGLGVFIQGFIYNISAKIFSSIAFVRPAEAGTGLWFGVLVAITGCLIL